MKYLIKKSKNGGLSGMIAKRRLVLFLGVMAFFAMLSVCCFLIGGGVSAVGMGVLFAVVPLVGFTMPEGLNLTDEEKKGMDAIAEHLNKQWSDYIGNNLSAEKMMDNIKEKLTEFAKENGFEKEKLEKMYKSLEDQGVELVKLKQKLVSEKDAPSGLRAKFFEKFDELAAAVKNKTVNYVIKDEPEELDESMVLTREVITTTSGVDLYERIGRSSGLFMKRRDRQYIDDIADVTVVAEVPEAFIFEEEGDEDGFVAIVEENQLKPRLKLSLIKNHVEAQVAAGHIVVTEQMMKWRTRAWASIQRLFRDKVMRDFQNKLTDKLLPSASMYIGTPLDGTIEEPNDIDAILAGIAQLESLNFYPDSLVLNPVDKWRISMLKDLSGAYLLPLIAQDGTFRITPLNIITSNKVAAGKYLMGESGLWKVEREEPRLRTGLVNDDLIKNRFTIVGEIFFLSYVPSNNEGGFLLGDFNEIKEALAIAVKG